MAFQIQNLACFEVELNPNSHRFYFKEDVIKPDMIVDEIFLMFDESYNDETFINTGNPFALKSTDNNAQLTNIEAIETLYLNIADAVKEFIVNLAFYQLYVTTGNRMQLMQNINRAIDTTKSFFYYNTTSTVRCLCYITYRKSTSVLNKIVNGSFTVDIPVDMTKEFQDILLSDFIPVNFQSYKIKKIVSNMKDYAFLNLISDTNNIENIPLKLLIDRDPRYDLFFNNITIDYTRSSLIYRRKALDENEGLDNFQLTFYY